MGSSRIEGILISVSAAMVFALWLMTVTVLGCFLLISKVFM
jgi:hypothetical protein